MRLVLTALLLCLLVSLIAAERPVVSFVTAEWPPYVSSRMPDNGMLVAITRAAFDRAGYDIVVTYMPWEQAVRQASIGQFDAVLGGSWSTEREETFLMSEPYFYTQNLLFCRREADISYEKLRDLRSYKIAVVRGYAVDPTFDKASYLKKVEVENLPQAIEMVLNGEADMFVEARLVALDTLTNMFPKRRLEVQPVYPPLRRDAVYNLFSMANPRSKELAEAFAEGLEELNLSGELDRIQARYGVK